MKRLLSTLIVLCFCFTGHATTPWRAYPFGQYSENGAYYYTSIPYGYQPGRFGKTDIFNAQNQKLYTINEYLHQDGFISNDGATVIEIFPTVYRFENAQSSPLINFFQNGIRGRTYYMADIFPDTSMLKWSYFNTAQWYRRAFVHNDTLYVVTNDSTAVLIETSTGQVLSKQSATVVLARFHANVPKVVRREVSFDKYPNDFNEYSGFYKPGSFLLADGRDFVTAFLSECKALNLLADTLELQAIYEMDIAVDRQGNGELMRLANDYRQTIDDPALTNEIREWLSSQKFVSDQIPSICEKWIFPARFGLIPPPKGK